MPGECTSHDGDDKPVENRCRRRSRKIDADIFCAIAHYSPSKKFATRALTKNLARNSIALVVHVDDAIGE